MREFCFETVLSTERNLKLLERAKGKGEEKIITRYDRALALVKNLIKVCDICHIYDNSAGRSFRIFKKRKELMYFDECDDWYLGIPAL